MAALFLYQISQDFQIQINTFEVSIKYYFRANSYAK